jgi:hypothetical protein
MRRGGGLGKKVDCLNECDEIKGNPVAYSKCVDGCDNAFKPLNIQLYDEKLGIERDDYITNFPDARNYVKSNPGTEYYQDRAGVETSGES